MFWDSLRILSTKSTISEKLNIAKLSNLDDDSKNVERPYLRKLKFGKLIFHSFQNIAQLFGTKIEIGSY